MDSDIKKLEAFTQYHGFYVPRAFWIMMGSPRSRRGRTVPKPPPRNLGQVGSPRRKNFSGVRSCKGKENAFDRAMKELNKTVKQFKKDYPQLIMVRSGWHEGQRYGNNTGGGFGTSGRSCNGWLNAYFFVDFANPRRTGIQRTEYFSQTTEVLGDEQDLSWPPIIRISSESRSFDLRRVKGKPSRLIAKNKL